jgi:mannose/cellobiose epimerase-like protein (N-acyl-D-glucosamine 2-epimerase family)
VIEDTPNHVALPSMMIVSAMGAWLAASGDREVAAKYFDDVAKGVRSGEISFDHRGENTVN